MGLSDGFLSLLGCSDCVSLEWHFWRMTIKVKLAEKDGIMVEVPGFSGADLERKRQVVEMCRQGQGQPRGLRQGDTGCVITPPHPLS